MPCSARRRRRIARVKGSPGRGCPQQLLLHTPGHVSLPAARLVSLWHVEGSSVSQPGRVRVERYVPQALVLPNRDVVISHAESGSVLAAAAQGLPQLCLPQGADQFLNAAAVESAGLRLPLNLLWLAQIGSAGLGKGSWGE